MSDSLTRWIVLFGAAVILWLFANGAYGHGNAEWIERSKWKACCDKVDCAIVGVTYVGDGWIFKHPFLDKIEFVPDDGNKLPSIDHHYWACFNIGPGTTRDKSLRSIFDPDGNPNFRPRCFFSPGAGM